MVNEKRLIDANVLNDTLEEWEENAVFGTANDGADGTTKILCPVPTTTREMQDLIAMQPTVDAVEVVHGRWIGKGGPMFQGKCSACGYATFDKPANYARLYWHYCPHCGAKMDLEGG